MTEPRGTWKVWRIARIDGRKCAGLVVEFIISAKTEQAVRELASDSVSDEDRATWLDRRTSLIYDLGKADDKYRETMIITHFTLPSSGDSNN